MNNFVFNPSSNVYEDMALNEEDHWWYRGLRDLIKYWLLKLNPQNILDAGCGTGENLKMYQDLGFDSFGIEYSFEAIAWCNKKGLNNIQQGSILDLPFNNNSFESISCLDVLGIFDNHKIQIILSEFSRVLKPNGFLIINSAALPWVPDNHNKYWDFKNKFYLKDLEDFLILNNFKILKSSYRVTLLFPIILILRIIDSILNSNEENIKGDTLKTNRLLNFSLFKVMQFENFLLRYINFPIGNSVFIVAQKI